MRNGRARWRRRAGAGGARGARGAGWTAAAALALTLVAAGAGAQPGHLALGARVGTTGAGAEAAIALGGRLALRAAATAGSVGASVHSRRVHYEGDLELAALLAVADLHPGGGAFRLSAGALINDDRLTATAPLREILVEHGYPVPQGLELGRVRARATVDRVAPYAGIGWGGGPGGRGLYVSFDLGAAYHGRPAVALDYDGPLPLDLLAGDTFDALRAAEERDLEAELADATFYPVVALTVGFRF